MKDFLVGARDDLHFDGFGVVGPELHGGKKGTGGAKREGRCWGRSDSGRHGCCIAVSGALSFRHFDGYECCWFWYIYRRLWGYGLLSWFPKKCLKIANLGITVMILVNCKASLSLLSAGQSASVIKIKHV